ncbi:50S ribosomal protein L10 [Candidatus Shapirobacteria bacterium CG09_land_8_20_14_0_10_38_17]|uniref:Large ribosomal subunit protein uL10 n=1 Tax=Candidatus Shapirobacteria bacterium CG09_land_8_20_14_0_10_38_17 TaxID=1974884 RepID=A0A2H0WTR2_9BACT|nr:MAG: 50S ribosomal protein L10 [Candidatus Shapirobacteria bacterium CG09_land_8_20_14_0_10_38_17]
MVSQTKIYEVENLKAKLKDAKSVFLTDYQGLDANSLNSLRQEVKKTGGDLFVVKNSLFKRAISGLGLNFDEQIFTGPAACLLGVEDEISSLKKAYQFLEGFGKNSFKVGVLLDNKQVLNGDEIARLANLPSLTALRAMLAGELTNIFKQLLFNLNSPLQRMMLILRELKNSHNEEVND